MLIVIYGLWICGIVLMWSLVTGQCIFDIWYCILVSVFTLSYGALHVPVQFFAYCSFLSIFRSYLPVFVLPFIPLPFSLPVVRLPLPFSSKNMKMEMIKRFYLRFRPFSTLMHTIHLNRTAENTSAEVAVERSRTRVFIRGILSYHLGRPRVQFIPDLEASRTLWRLLFPTSPSSSRFHAFQALRELSFPASYNPSIFSPNTIYIYTQPKKKANAKRIIGARNLTNTLRISQSPQRKEPT